MLLPLASLAVALAVGTVATREIARYLSKKVTESWKYAGLVAKLAYICGFNCDQLEDIRWTFVPSQQSVGLSSRRLFVSFAGGAVRIGGLTREEFRNSVQSFESSLPLDQLYCCDPTGMAYYTADKQAQGAQVDGSLPALDLLADHLRKTTAEYQQVLLIGNCMASVPLMVCAPSLPSFAHILLFNAHRNVHWQAKPFVNRNTRKILESRIVSGLETTSPRVWMVCTREDLKKWPQGFQVNVEGTKTEAEWRELLLSSTTRLTFLVYPDPVTVRQLRNSGQLVALMKAVLSL